MKVIAINDPEHSCQVQKTLFRKGYRWAGNDSLTIQNTHALFLCLDENPKRITYSTREAEDQIANGREIVTLEQLFPWNWNEFLKGEISHEDWREAKSRASSWVTCACGVQCKILPRISSGAPEDMALRLLGGDKGFLRAIDNEDRKTALELLEAIEERSAKLIQIEKQKLQAELSEIETQLTQWNKLIERKNEIEKLLAL